MTDIEIELVAALELALRYHGVMFLSDPPQDAWKAMSVETVARTAIAKAKRQAEPVAMQYIALCDAMRYSEREDEWLSPEEVLERLNDELCEENDRLRRALEQAEPVVGTCDCHRCIKEYDLRYVYRQYPVDLTRMILCPTCGNKRCPKASDHRLDCTSSNEPGQPGSVYTAQAEPVVDAVADSGNPSF